MSREAVKRELSWLVHVWFYPDATREEWEAARQSA